MKREKHNIYSQIRREDWAVRGTSCIVKVLPIWVNASHLSGYFTLGRFLVGKTPAQIQIALGLEQNKLIDGAKVFKFKRLPFAHEVEYELTADYPGGLKYNPPYSDDKYLPGTKYIHQWEIKSGYDIPVQEDDVLELNPGQSFPYNWIEK